MKILVVCQHYWPEPYPLTDVCEELASRGHIVHVVTGVPNYPMGKIYADYRGGRRRQQCHNGVHITRTFTIPRRNNVLFRGLNYFSYAISSSWHIAHLPDDYDVVFANQTSPVIMSSAAVLYARKHAKKLVLYCMDLWPACLAAGGVEQSSVVYRVFNQISRKIYKKADRILITSRMFREYLVEQHKVRQQRLVWLPQYADAKFRQKLPAKKSRKTIDLMFAGNVGAAQSLDTVLEAAQLLRQEIPNLCWHIVGDGSELERLKNQAAKCGLDNIVFYGRKPLQEMPELYAQADAMLVTLTADPLISLTLPGKVQTYMAAGKPILAAANGEIPKTIGMAQCGFCAAAEDAQGLAQAVRRFLHSPDKEQLGVNAKKYYETHFTRACFMDRLEQELREHAKESA